MAGMVVQHNLNSINANNKMNVNVAGSKKSTEKLSSGYAINRAGDNAAGLAISEKMRSQTRGLEQAVNNANDGISLIQTAEGGLNETHSILQRMRELSVQSANGTYQNETDREAMQLEVEALKSEVDRISQATEYNGMKLLDGSLGGQEASTGDYGARYGIHATLENQGWDGTVTSNVEGVSVSFESDGATAGGETAEWDETGKALTIKLASGKTYSQSQIDDLVKNASTAKLADQASAAKVDVKLESGVIKSVAELDNTTDTTVAGIRATSGDAASLDGYLVGGGENVTQNYANEIKFISNSYGVDERTIQLFTDAEKGKEGVNTASGSDAPSKEGGVKTGTFELHLSTGVEYSEKDIQNILAKSGYGLDMEVKLTTTADESVVDGDVKFYSNMKDTDGTLTLEMTGSAGQGVGKDALDINGQGLTFQIGANGVEDQRVTLNVQNMSSTALGINNISVDTQDDANAAIDSVDSAINSVSMQRAGLGALQNRLEYTVNNLTTTNENITAAESQIRDTDMAKEMISYTKFNILQQASQAMLAQANQAPQAVLQLLG